MDDWNPDGDAVLQALLRASPLPALVCMAEREHAVIAVNRKLSGLLGYRDDERGLASRWWERVVPDPARRQQLWREWAGAIAMLRNTGAAPASIEARLTCRDGSERCLELDFGLHAGLAVVLGKDVTARRQAEAEATEARGFLQRLVDTSPSMIFVVDETGRLVFANRSLADYYQTAPEGIVSMATEQLHANPVQAEGFIQDDIEVIRTGNEIVKEEMNTAPDGRVHWFHTVKVRLERPDGRMQCLGIATDITARKEAEEARRQLEAGMWQSQKLESLGVLASGIAHDFNNLLTSIRTNVHLVESRLAEASPALQFLHGIELAAHRASQLTGQMLAYVGRGQASLERLCLADLVREMRTLLDAVVSKKALFQLDLAPASVEADAAQLHQVVLNLFANASDALGEGTGQIVVRTGTREFLPAELRSASMEDTPQPGAYAYIEVEDNGCGMTEATLARVFDPFFSTKFTGRGLGLSAVLGIVRGHRGTVQVDSQLGRGTRFRVLLPAAAPPVHRNASGATPNVPVGGTLLVVDDEEMVRSTVCVMLEDAGFRVYSAVDGQDGVDVFERHSEQIDAVILDLTMPRLDGWQCLRRLRALRADIPVLLMSGYAAEVSVPVDVVPAPPFLQKPFDPAELVQIAARLLAPAR